MAKFAFAMNLSLDGYVDHEPFAPDAILFRHWIEQVDQAAGALYGRKTYDLMRYWDGEQPDWSGDERDFAVAWRSKPKWVVSRTLESVGPNATLISGDFEAAVRALKAEQVGEIDVAGPEMAHGLARLGLIDEYRLYFHPVVLGEGRPFFPGPLPRLRLTDSQRIGADVMKLTYVPG